MEKNYNDIEHIESWLKGKMQQADRQAFEAQLATDEALKLEVDAYRKIFTGFQAARRENFAAEVGNWTQQAKAAGEKKPMRSIQPAKSKQGKIVQMKRSGAMRPMWQKLAMAAGFILVLGAAAFWWMSRQYTDEQLVANAYLPLRSENAMGDAPEINTILQKFNEAHRLFKEEKYQESSAIMSIFIQEYDSKRASVGELNYQLYSENARWTKLLADFAAGGVTEENMLLILGVFEKQTSPEYAAKARELREGLTATWRR